ncbi:MAG: hypothetical protein KJ077_33040 [Anaerolineae bacterium]|nr:hypothetical protein [Anaerolineae bacterium]
MQSNLFRPYTEQFNKARQRQIEMLLSGFSQLLSTDRDYKYQVYELQRCLYAGLLLAALHIACSLLELFVRDLAIRKEFELRDQSSSVERIKRRDLFRIVGTFQREFEEDRKATFSALVKTLVDNRVISNKDADAVLDFYKNTRIPLSHGLVRRFVIQRDDIAWVEEEFGRIDRFHSIEEVVEDNALSHLKFVLKFIKKYQTKDGGA